MGKFARWNIKFTTEGLLGIEYFSTNEWMSFYYAASLFNWRIYINN